MSTQLKLLDTFQLTGQISSIYACGRSPDDRIFIVFDNGLYILAFKPTVDSVFPEFSCHKYFLTPSDYTVSDKLSIDLNGLLHELPKDVVYEVLPNVPLSSHINQVNAPPVSIVQAQWSHSGLVDGSFSMLAILTSFHSLDVYVKSVDECHIISYNIVVNLTKAIVEECQKDFVYAVKLPPLQRAKTLKKRVEMVTPRVFQWGHHLEGNCCWMFVGHFAGEVSVWKIFGVRSDDRVTRSEFVSRYKSQLSHISALHWYKTATNEGVLCLGDLDGRVAVLHVEDGVVTKEVQFYAQKDHPVDQLTVTNFLTYTFLIAVKQTCLLIFGLDSKGKVFDVTAYNLPKCLYIAGISTRDNILTLATMLGDIKQLALSVHFNKINVEKKDMVMNKSNLGGHRSHGLFMSENRVLVGIVSSPNKLPAMMKGRKAVVFHLFHNVSVDPLKMLLHEVPLVGSLHSFWDCFEALRLVCFKEHKFPWEGAACNPDLDELSLIQLKTLRLIARLSENVFKIMKNVVTYEIKPYIFLHHLVDMKLTVQRLRSSLSSQENLTVFEKQSAFLQLSFLKELIVSGVLAKAQVGASFVRELTGVISVGNEMKCPDMVSCNFCGGKLIGATCLPPHADSRCSFSMMPIGVLPAFRCIICDSLAHLEAVKNLENVSCPYCDYPMERICLSGEIPGNIDSILNNYLLEYSNKSKCYSDCIKTEENMDDFIANLPENDLIYVNVSDDELDNEHSELERVYLMMSEAKIDDGLTETK